MSRFRYGLIDLSYILSRNVHSCYKKGQDQPGDVVRSIIQTIGKLGRDFYITADKYILLNDTWSKIHGGYFRTYMLNGQYKISHINTTKEDVEKAEKDPELTEEDIKKTRDRYITGLLKKEAKKIILKNFGSFGIPCVSVEGWEVDDLVRLSGVLLENEPSGKRSVVISKDSDLLYSLTPRLDYFKIPTAGSLPEVISYSQVWDSLTDEIKNSGISLYDYKCYSDSLGAGHNDLSKTKKLRANVNKTILEVLNGDYSNVENKDLFEQQLRTFRIQDFPNFEEAREKLIYAFVKSGRIGSFREFKAFCDRYKINSDTVFPGSSISKQYYNNIINNLDTDLYEDFCKRKFGL